MSTLIQTWVDPDGGGVGSYASLAAAYAANFGASGTDLPGQDEVVKVWCRASAGTTDSGGAVDISKFTTDATHTITLEAAPGARHPGWWVNNGLFYRLSPAAGTCLTLTNSNIIVRFIAFGLTADGNTQMCVSNAGANNVIEGCLAKALSLGAFTVCSGFQTANVAARISFCIATDFVNANARAFWKSDAGSNYGKFYNCTAINSTTGFGQSNGKNTFVNCLAIGNAAGFSVAADASNMYNASDDLTAPGNFAITGLTSDIFVDYANENLHLKYPSPIGQTGLNLNSLASGSYYDADGVVVPSDAAGWDRGAYNQGRPRWGYVFLPRPFDFKKRRENQQLRRFRAVWAAAKKRYILTRRK